MNFSRVSRGRPLFMRLPSTTQLSPRHFSTQKAYQPSSSGGLKSVAFFLVGVPAGWYGFDYMNASKVQPHPHDFYDGSLEWKGKAVKPFAITDTNLWLRREQSSHKGPSGSGVESWDIVRCPSNSICEDNLVTAQRALPNWEKPWLFWGVFDGHV